MIFIAEKTENGDVIMSDCCYAPFIGETDLCSECLEHAGVAEEEELSLDEALKIEGKTIYYNGVEVKR